MYVLWSMKMSGWKSKAGNYTTQLSQAQQFTKAQALKLMNTLRDHNKAVTLLPVEVELIQ